MARSIVIKDSSGQDIGDLMTASNTDILTYLGKGLQVFDKKSGEQILEADVTAAMGVSDGEIIME
jgi:hypothetical protein